MNMEESFWWVQDWTHPQEMQPTGCLRDSVDRLRCGGNLVGFEGCSLGAILPSSDVVPFGRWWHARGRGHCRVKPEREQWHALSASKHRFD